jgi:hypothetical protein
MSALPPKADIAGRNRDVCFVPKADIHLTLLDHLVGGHAPAQKLTKVGGKSCRPAAQFAEWV